MKKILASAVCCMLAGCAARSGGIVTDKTQQITPHAEPVCMLKSPLPSNIRYTIIGQIQGSKKFYGSTTELIPVMAQEARSMGADAVVNLKVAHRVGLFAWAQPVGSGTGVKLANKADLNCLALGGELR
jgi:hypothetical protein